MEWPKVVGPTVMSSTTETKLGGANFKLPAAAKYIKEMYISVIAPEGVTANEPVACKVLIRSDDNKIVPYQVLAPVVGSNLAKSGCAMTEKSEAYPINCPVKGGSEIEVYGAGLFNHTIEPYIGVTLVLTDYKPGPQVFAKLGTFTNTGTAAAEVAGSGIRISGGTTIREVIAVVLGTTVATLKGICGKGRLASSGLKGMGDISLMFEGVPGSLITDATTPSLQESARLTRVKCDCPITDPVDLDDYFTLIVALTTTGNFIYNVLFTK